MIRSKFVMVGLAALLTMAACAKPDDPPEPQDKVLDVAVIQPVRRDAVRSISLPGDLVGYFETALYAKATGYLTSIYVDKGDWVKTGQVLADLEVPELHHNLAFTQAREEINLLTWQRLKRVRDSDPRLVAQEDVDIAYARWAEAKADVGVLQTMVDYTKIVAPYDGVITGRFVDPGALVRAGGTDYGVSSTGAEISSGATEGAGGHLGGGGVVLTMALLDTLRIYIYVPEQEAARVYPGMPAVVKLRAFPHGPIHARITRFASALDLTTRTMLTEIDIKNPQHRYYPRMYADVTIELVRHPNAIKLPVSAVGGVSETQAGSPATHAYVFVVKGTRLVKTAVSTGISDGRFIEITSGLRGDEWVVEAVDASLVDGEEVRPIPTKAHEYKMVGTD